MSTGTITSLGLGSSLDLQGIIDSLKEVDEEIIAQKETEISELEAQKDEFNVINSMLLSMKTTALDLSLESNYLGRTVTNSGTDVLSATATEGAATGTYTVNVERIALQSSFLSEGKSLSTASVYVPTSQISATGFSDADSDIVLAEDEEMTITIGSEDDRQIITITGSAGGMTLNEVIDEINNSTTYVTAESVEGDDDGLFYLQISAASGEGGEENRVSVTVPPESTAFSAPDTTFSYSLGDGEEISLTVSADTTLEELVELINDDENNPGITASLIDTGSGDKAYRIQLKADETGEDNRIRIIDGLEDLSMTEQNGSGNAMSSDTAVSFDSSVIITSALGNNTIVFQENGGAQITATIDDGVYDNGDDLAQAVETALEEASNTDGVAADYQVSWDEESGSLIIQENNTLESMTILWEESASTAAATLGFSENKTITPYESSLNASVTIDGVTFQRQSNSSLDDLVSGLTLSLTSTGSSTLNIDSDTESIVENITSLVTALNDLLEEVDANDDYDEDNEIWGTLAKSTSIRSMKMELLSLFSSYTDTGTEISSLTDLGLEIDSDGNVTLDEDTLAEQIESNFDGIYALMVGTDEDSDTDGLAEQLNAKFGEYVLSSGILESETDAIDDRIERLEETIEAETERLEKRYDTLTTQFVALDSYMQTMESQQSYISQIFDATSSE